MWNSGFVKAIRWIVYIPLILITLALFDFALTYVTIELFDFNWNFWLVLIFIALLGGTIVTFPMIISVVVTALTVSICPNRKIGGYIYAVLAVMNFANLLYVLWTMDIDYTGRVITTLAIGTLVIVVVATFSITSAINFEEDG